MGRAYILFLSSLCCTFYVKIKSQSEMHLQDKNNFSRYTIAFRCCLDLGCFYFLKKEKGIGAAECVFDSLRLILLP